MQYLECSVKVYDRYDLQDLDKRDAQAEKKRESIMVNFNATKGQLSSLEHAMKTLQVDLEKAQFALDVKKGKLPGAMHGYVTKSRLPDGIPESSSLHLTISCYTSRCQGSFMQVLRCSRSSAIHCREHL